MRKLPSVIIPDSATQYLQEPDEAPEKKPEIQVGTSQPIVARTVPTSFCYPPIEATPTTISPIAADIHTNVPPGVVSETTSQLRARL
jgi:hypothetical protein